MASSSESKAKPNILGMIVPSSCSSEFKGWKTIGGMREALAKFFETVCMLRQEAARLLLTGESSLLASTLAASTKIVVPPEYHLDIVAGLAMRLTAYGVPIDQQKSQAALLEKTLRANWTKRGGKILDAPGGSGLDGGGAFIMQSKKNKLQAGGPEKTPAQQAFASGRNKARGQGRRRRGAAADDDEEKGSEESDGDHRKSPKKADESASESSDDDSVEDLESAFVRQALGGGGEGSALLECRHVAHVVKLTQKAESDAYNAFKIFLNGTPVGAAVALEIANLNPAALLSHDFVSPLERTVGVIPWFKVALNCTLFQLQKTSGQTTEEIALNAAKVFTSLSNKGSDPASAKAAFEEARKLYELEVGHEEANAAFTDEGKLGELYIRSLETGKDKRIQALGAAVRKSFTRLDNDAAATGKMAAKRTLELVQSVAVNEWAEVLKSAKESETGRATAASSKFTSPAKREKSGGDGPNQSAFNAQATANSGRFCFICGSEGHQMNDKNLSDAAGGYFHTRQEVRDYHMRRKAAAKESESRGAHADSDPVAQQKHRKAAAKESGSRGAHAGSDPVAQHSKSGQGGKGGAGARGGVNSKGKGERGKARSGGALNFTLDEEGEAEFEVMEHELGLLAARRKLELFARSKERQMKAKSGRSRGEVDDDDS